MSTLPKLRIGMPISIRASLRSDPAKGPDLEAMDGVAHVVAQGRHPRRRAWTQVVERDRRRRRTGRDAIIVDDTQPAPERLARDARVVGIDVRKLFRAISRYRKRPFRRPRGESHHVGL